LAGWKVGYLVATVVRNVILIRTFLFLTMDGTPEGTKLYQRLGLRRAAKTLLKLDDLTTFMDTDIAADVELTSLLNECGCSHLLAPPIPCTKAREGYAQDLRRYLGLDDAVGNEMHQHQRPLSVGRLEK
jgi:hypothetical protein